MHIIHLGRLPHKTAKTLVKNANIHYNSPCYYAPIAQLVERIHGKDEVTGSTPVWGSRYDNEATAARF